MVLYNKQQAALLSERLQDIATSKSVFSASIRINQRKKDGMIYLRYKLFDRVDQVVKINNVGQLC
jgi:hypothetical protein